MEENKDNILEKQKFNSLYGKIVSEELKEKVYVIYEGECSEIVHIYGIYTTREKAKIEYDNIIKYRIINENLYIKEMKVNTFYKDL